MNIVCALAVAAKLAIPEVATTPRPAPPVAVQAAREVAASFGVAAGIPSNPLTHPAILHQLMNPELARTGN